MIEEMVGRGGFSQVFRATTPDGHTVAVKVLLPPEKTTDASSYPDSLVDRFVREARLLERLRDPFTIDLYDHGRSPSGHFYMVFEFLQGRELFDIIKNDGKQPHGRVAHVLRQTLKALQSAHALGILHRDIKPNNIMLVRGADDQERVKVLDFGIAKMYGDSAKIAGNDLTAAGVLVGTPRYMSPEQLRANQLGPASDIYSLGIVAIEMLTGRKAIRGRDRIHIIQQQLSPTKFSIPDEISCPQDLRNIVLRMVEKNVHARYQSAAQVLRDLDKWQVAATEGRTIVEVVSAAEIHTPRAETAAADEDTNVHRISVDALDAIDQGPPAPDERDATISEAQIETHSQPSLNARLTGRRGESSGNYGGANSESFERVDTGPGSNPPRTDMSSGDLDRTLARNPLQEAAGISTDSMETMESDAFRQLNRDPSGQSGSHSAPANRGGEFAIPSDEQATREHDARSREELLAAARTSGYQSPGESSSTGSDPDSSAFDLPTTKPRMTASAPSDMTSQNDVKKGLETSELVGILVSVPLPGIGHVLLGQKAKGLAIFVAFVLTLGLLYFVALAVAFDAFLVVRASRKRDVGAWEFFPGFGELLN